MRNKKFTPEQDRERYDLLGLEYRPDSQLMGFEQIPLHVLEQLVERGYADEDEAQNDSPTIGEFIEWMQEQEELHGNDTITAHGYIIHNERSDRRISVEGLEQASEVPDHVSAWWKFNRRADECDENRSWWD